jgi:2-C-methyl-D-erythritol 2,4-cyclodiphosphate synthase
MMRIGHGYDAHRFAPSRALILGGVRVPCGLGLAGHSDADVLAHAAADALLGACALGDIGGMFPDSDPRYEGADSIMLLSQVAARLRGEGWEVSNIDTTVIAQAPKLAPYIGEMRENIARACGVGVSQVSVKATTEEGMGFTGHGEGISAHAVCLIDRAG